MDTRERTETRPPEHVRRRSPALVVAAAFIVILVLGIAGSVLLFTGDGESEPVAASEANPEITFDGESAMYYGPTLVTPGVVEFTLVNDSAESVILAVWGMSGEALAEELARTPVGTDMALEPDSPSPDGELTDLTVLPGKSARTWVSVTESLTYLVDSVTYEEDHVWRVAQIEVVEP